MRREKPNFYRICGGVLRRVSAAAASLGRIGDAKLLQIAAMLG
jgi:hypothetical protein